jgi:hypothetical protein
MQNSARLCIDNVLRQENPRGRDTKGYLLVVNVKLSYPGVVGDQYRYVGARRSSERRLGGHSLIAGTSASSDAGDVGHCFSEGG